jgi:hypothetical protein
MDGEAPTALIGAYEPGPAGLRALVPLAGATLVEQQVRRAITAGAAQVLLLVDEQPAELIAAIQRLRHDGLAVGVVEGIDAAADALAGQKVLLIADACLPEPLVLRDLSHLPVPAVATLADIPDHSRYERIDANVRWAGAALIDGHRVAETATMLGGWDPVSTLLRRAVQDGAMRLAVDESPPMLLVDTASLATAEAAIVAAARRPAGDWISRFLFAHIEELALPTLLRRRVDASWLALLAALLAVLAGAEAWFGWRWLALGSLLLGGPLAAGAARLARVQARPIAFDWALEAVRVIGAVVASVGLVTSLAMTDRQWGWWLVETLLLGGMAALEAALRLRGSPRMLWVASLDGLAWAMLPLALIGRWGIGLGALAAYACLSFAWVMGVLLRKKQAEG